MPTIFLVEAIAYGIKAMLSPNTSNSLDTEINERDRLEEEDRDRLEKYRVEWKERINSTNPCQASEEERLKMKKHWKIEGSKSFRKMMKEQRKNKK